MHIITSMDMDGERDGAGGGDCDDDDGIVCIHFTRFIYRISYRVALHLLKWASNVLLSVCLAAGVPANEREQHGKF